MELVSVIMPCYNDGAYIQEAVASVWAQTYSNTELIIIDDGSDDPMTIEVLEMLGAKPEVTLLHTDHLGPAAARNFGIVASAGTYILPVDADDRIEPNYIEKAVSVMEADPELGVVYCHADLFGAKAGPWELPDYSFEHMLLDNVVFVTALFRKADWGKVGGFRTDMKQGMEDYDFWLSILEIGKKIYQLPEVLFHYRIKPTSRTTGFQKDPAVVKEVYRNIYLQHPIFYERYRSEYAMVLRDALIEQLFLNRAYQKTIGVLEYLKRIPILKTVIKRMIINGESK